MTSTLDRETGPDTTAGPGRHVDVDLLVVGAGPAGLYAAYYAGFRGLRTALVDSLPEPGGICWKYTTKVAHSRTIANSHNSRRLPEAAARTSGRP